MMKRALFVGRHKKRNKRKQLFLNLVIFPYCAEGCVCASPSGLSEDGKLPVVTGPGRPAARC